MKKCGSRWLLEAKMEENLSNLANSVIISGHSAAEEVIPVTL